MNSTINNHIAIIGVPLDLGSGRRGVDMGPSAIRYAEIVQRLASLGYQIHDIGDIPVDRDAVRHSPGVRMHYLEEIERVNIELCKKVAEQLDLKRFPLILGGDHSIAIGTLAGIRRLTQKLGVVWFDAHSDINTPETSPSGNIHGMPVAICLGFGHERLTAIGGPDTRMNAQNFVQIGIRDLDPGEKVRLREQGITVFTMHSNSLAKHYLLPPAA